MRPRTQFAIDIPLTMILLIRGVLGSVFIAFGLAGLILPILPGWLFFGVAAMVLFPQARFARKTAAWLEQRFPWSRRIVRAVVR